MPAYNTDLDIKNRALQHCGATRIASNSEISKNAYETAFVYDKIREAELRRNVWRFSVKKGAIRPMTITTKSVTFATWAIGTTYPVGFVVSYGGEIWQSAVGSNIGNTPSTESTQWIIYFGQVFADAVLNSVTYTAYSGATSYALGALVSYQGSFWQSLVGGNLNNAPFTPGSAFWTLYTPTNQVSSYFAGELAYDGSNVVYLSLISSNLDAPPSSNWLTLTGATLSAPNILYPLGSGPTQQEETRNVFPLPNGFLREAPQDPKAGSMSYLGAPSGLQYTDWEYNGQFIISESFDPFIFRFVANMKDVNLMDALFCEGLGCRVALEVCEMLTQSDAKLKAIGSAYDRFMTEARAVNGIEEGPTEPPVDDLIACRI